MMMMIVKPFFSFSLICDFNASVELSFQKSVKIFILIYHHMARSNSMEYLLTFFSFSSFEPKKKRKEKTVTPE